MVRLGKQPVDYIVIGLSPALIMTLVGSLVFFLLHIFYEGQFILRLNIVMGLFIFAAVLVARIAIDEDREYAALFAVPLGLVTLLAIGRFVTFDPDINAGWAWMVNTVIIGVIWWCADKLTWDCTMIDEQQRDSGRGLLESVGLEKPPSTSADPEEEAIEGTTSRDDTQDDATRNWWARHVERRRRPHAPGVWVVYFSLAVLPIFGLGQSFVPPSGRSYTFSLLFVYVASALGLLLTTSFLGLRRYLRQRDIEMPSAMAGAWLTIGGMLLVAILFFAALLPRPDSQSFADQLPFALSSPAQEDSSRYAQGNDGTNKQDYGQPDTNQEPGDDEPAATVESTDSESSGTSSDEEGEGDSNQEGQLSESQQDTASESAPQQGGEPGENGQPNEGAAEQTDPSPEGSPQEPAGRDREPTSDENSGDERDSGEPNGGSQEEKPSDPHDSRNPQGNRLADMDPRLTPEAWGLLDSFASGLFKIFRWIFFLFVGLITLWSLWQSREEIVRSIHGLIRAWREFWRRLFGRRVDEPDELEEEKRKVAGPAPRRFADYPDPFASGTVDQFAPDELVRYTFEAMEAWAREQGFPRDVDDTPHEFAQAIARHAEPLALSARRMADLYCAAAYAPGTLRREKAMALRGLWEELHALDRREAAVI